MPNRKLKTPRLDADRERRRENYVFADLIFANDIDDEFSAKVPAELTLYAASQRSALEAHGILFSVNDEDQQVRVKIAVQSSEVMISNPTVVRDAFTALLKTLQQRFLCSFETAPYADARILEFWGQDYQFPLRDASEINSPIGRRLIMQQAHAVRAEVAGRLEVLDELTIVLESEDLDENMKVQQRQQYASLRTALESQLEQSESDPGIATLQTLAKLNLLPYIVDAPVAQVGITSQSPAPAWGESEDPESWPESMAPTRCQTKKDVLLHPIMKAAMRQLGYEPDLEALATILADSENVERYLRMLTRIIRKIHTQNPVHANLLSTGFEALCEQILCLAKSSNGGLSVQGLESVPESVLFNDSEEWEEHLDEYPEILFYLQNLLKNTESVHHLNLLNQYLEGTTYNGGEVFIGKRTKKGVVSNIVRSTQKEIPNFPGEIYEVYFKKNDQIQSQLHTLNEGVWRPLVAEGQVAGRAQKYDIANLIHLESNHIKKDDLWDADVYDSEGNRITVCLHRSDLSLLTFEGELVVNSKNKRGTSSCINYTYRVKGKIGYYFAELRNGQKLYCYVENEKEYKLFLKGDLVTNIVNTNLDYGIFLLETKSGDSCVFRFQNSGEILVNSKTREVIPRNENLEFKREFGGNALGRVYIKDGRRKIKAEFVSADLEWRLIEKNNQWQLGYEGDQTETPVNLTSGVGLTEL